MTRFPGIRLCFGATLFLAALVLLVPASVSAQPAADSGARVHLLFQGAALGRMNLSNASEDPGKYQFSYGTWASVGGKGDPARASEAEQDRRAAMLLTRSGAGHWPVCG